MRNRYQASPVSVPDSKPNNIPMSTPKSASCKKLENNVLDGINVDYMFQGVNICVARLVVVS